MCIIFEHTNGAYMETNTLISLFETPIKNEINMKMLSFCASRTNGASTA